MSITRNLQPPTWYFFHWKRKLNVFATIVTCCISVHKIYGDDPTLWNATLTVLLNNNQFAFKEAKRGTWHNFNSFFLFERKIHIFIIMPNARILLSYSLTSILRCIWEIINVKVNVDFEYFLPILNNFLR